MLLRLGIGALRRRSCWMTSLTVGSSPAKSQPQVGAGNADAERVLGGVGQFGGTREYTRVEYEAGGDRLAERLGDIVARHVRDAFGDDELTDEELDRHRAAGIEQVQRPAADPPACNRSYR